MNQNQRNVLVWAVIVTAVMVLFPPWLEVSHNPGGSDRQGSWGPSTTSSFHGYEALWEMRRHNARIDVARLLVQIVVTALAFGVLYLYNAGPTAKAGSAA